MFNIFKNLFNRVVDLIKRIFHYFSPPRVAQAKKTETLNRRLRERVGNKYFCLKVEITKEMKKRKNYEYDKFMFFREIIKRIEKVDREFKPLHVGKVTRKNIT